MSGSCLVVIETSGNQAYIFDSNRLRQNVGASELVLRAGSEWVLEAVREQTGRALWNPDTKVRMQSLRDPAANPPVGEGNPVEVVIATSGRAELLVRDEETGCRIVTAVTRRALREAPGLGVTGVVVRLADVGGEGGLPPVHRASRHAAGLLGRVRSELPPPEARFRRVPLTSACAATGLPAAVEMQVGQDPPEDTSQVARSKFEAARRTGPPIAAESAIREPLRRRLVKSVTGIESSIELGWMAVVHADGNGVGRVIRQLAEEAGRTADGERSDVNRRRDFSTGLELVALEAFDRALAEAVEALEAARRIELGSQIRMLPLVLGGDDLTVVCDATLALPFAAAYLRAFEERSRVLLEGRLPAGRQGLTAAAGVAVVKPHFPFHAAYELAEALCQRAKAGKGETEDRPQGWSSIDFHVLHDTGADLDRIRSERRSFDGEVSLHGGPYVVGHIPEEAGKWMRARDFGRLREAAELLLRRDGAGDRRLVSSSLAHDLRAAVLAGRKAADFELRRALRRLPPDELAPLLAVREHGRESLLRDDGTTGFLDAMDAAELWPEPVEEVP